MVIDGSMEADERIKTCYSGMLTMYFAPQLGPQPGSRICYKIGLWTGTTFKRLPAQFGLMKSCYDLHFNKLEYLLIPLTALYFYKIRN
jgi:hypothetical protein